MIPIDGSIKEITSSPTIFEQFPAYNERLPIKPKIAILRAKYYKFIGVGHHSIENKHIVDNNICIKRMTRTKHFRWNLQGKLKAEKWKLLFANPLYKGWKDVAEYENICNIYNKNLIEYGK